MKIAVIGVGYVGLVSGTCFAEIGCQVTCIDVDQKKIDGLNSGVVPIYEPGLEELVKQNMGADRLHFTTDLQEAVARAELLFIAVGTPPGEDGSADLQYVLAVARGIAECMDDYKVIINKSTVPVGTGDKVANLVSEVLKERGQSIAFDVVSNPEFLKEGAAIDDFMRPDRVVVGVQSEKARTLMARLYEPFTRNGHPVIFSDIRSAEMIKYAANAMLATRISFMNEVAQLCEKMGANIDEVRQGIGTDSRIGMPFLYAGLGYGGSCFPKDVQALVRMGQAEECPMEILEATEAVNKRQRYAFIEIVLKHYGGDVAGKHFAIWGLAFKPGTDDMREAPSIDIIQALLDRGATVNAYDPVAIETASHALGEQNGLTFTDSQYAVLNGADALLLLTEWKAFRRPEFDRIRLALKEPVILDGRNQYDPVELAEMNFTYISIGR